MPTDSLGIYWELASLADDFCKSIFPLAISISGREVMAISIIPAYEGSSFRGITIESVGTSSSNGIPENEFIDILATSASLSDCTRRYSASFSFTSAMSRSLRSVYPSFTRSFTTSTRSSMDSLKSFATSVIS